MNEHQCIYEEDIKMLRDAYVDMKTSLGTIQAEIKSIKNDIGEIKQKLNSYFEDIAEVKGDISYLMGSRRSNPNNYWLKFSVTMLKDLVILAIMGIISLKVLGVV